MSDTSPSCAHRPGNSAAACVKARRVHAKPAAQLPGCSVLSVVTASPSASTTGFGHHLFRAPSGITAFWHRGHHQFRAPPTSGRAAQHAFGTPPVSGTASSGHHLLCGTTGSKDYVPQRGVGQQRCPAQPVSGTIGCANCFEDHPFRAQPFSGTIGCATRFEDHPFRAPAALCISVLRTRSRHPCRTLRRLERTSPAIVPRPVSKRGASTQNLRRNCRAVLSCPW